MPSAWQDALRRLARRDHSEQEIRLVLREKGHADAEIDAAVVRLRELRLVDDAGLAARFARSGLQHGGLGRHRLKQSLRKRGVTKAVAEAGVQEALAQVSEVEVVDRLARRYWKARARKSPESRLRALWAFLLRRGFPATLILSRLKALWPRWQDALDGLEPAEVDPASGETED